MNTTTAVVVIVVVALVLATMCFAVVVLTRSLAQMSRLLLAKNPIEAARAERILNDAPRPPLVSGPSPADLP